MEVDYQVEKSSFSLRLIFNSDFINVSDELVLLLNFTFSTQWANNPTLRHSRATFLAEDGMGKDYLQVFLGHDQPGTTEIYTKTAAIDTDRKFRRIINNKVMD